MKMGHVATMILSAVLSVQAGEANMAEVEALQSRVHNLEKEIKRLTVQMKSDKWGLRWVDCQEAFEADCENKIPILAEVPSKAIKSNDGKPTHILIEGDNYHALTCLNFTHRGRIDVIYIDPPYNTGSDGFTYKDRRYLEKFPDGTPVPKDHPLRHSYWLSFMDKRLRLAKELLSSRGVVFISIDDNEMANLKLLCDKIFLEKNFIGNIAWESKTKTQNTESAYDKLQPKVEHILVYAANARNHFHLRHVGERVYDLNDAKGAYREHPVECMTTSGVRGRATMVFPILGVNPPKGQQWKIGDDTRKAFESRGDIFLRENWPVLRMRPSDERSSITEPFWGFISKNIGTAETAKKELASIIGLHDFETVKPVALIQKLLFHASEKNSIILDFFAGSATTLESTARLNVADDGCRQCIVCTDDEHNICSRITYPRIRKIVEGYISTKAKSEELFREEISLSSLKHSKELLERIDEAKATAGKGKSEVVFEDGCVIVRKKTKKNEQVPPLGGSLKYYKTAFVGKHASAVALDEDRVTLAAKAGALLALAEDTLEEKRLPKASAQYWQHFTNSAHKHTLIYFSEDLSGFASLVATADKIREDDKAARLTVYVFAIGSVEGFDSEFDDLRNIELKPIPEPILAIYRTINEG